jgi:hypothetical protein
MKILMSLPTTLLGGFVLMGSVATASATPDVYTVNVYTGDIGFSFDAVAGSVSLFTSGNASQHAEFTYTGTLNFSDTESQNATSSGDLNSVFFGTSASGISGYTDLTAATTADYGSFSTLSSFLAASGSVAGFGYGSLYIFSETGAAFRSAHPRLDGDLPSDLDITHDDGVGVYIPNGPLLPGSTTGPTTQIKEQVQIPPNTGYTLVYGRENGSPSVPEVSVPEPMSVTLLGAGLFGLGMLRYKRRDTTQMLG